MEVNETKKLENLRKLIAPYFNTLKEDNDKTKVYTAQIKMLDYYELGCTIMNMLKMCVLALDHDGNRKLEEKDSAINVGLVLEMVLEMFPLDEFELLSEINQILIPDSQNSAVPT